MANIDFRVDPYNRDTSTLPPLVGLIGKARAGKDTFAARLVDRHGYRRVALADPLKAAALAIDPIVVPGEGPDDPFEPTLRLSQVVEEYGWDAAKEQIPEVRRILQHVGSALREKVNEGVWLNLAMREVDARTTPVVITDVRYRNEAEAIKARGGQLVRIVRYGAVMRGDANHVSETELDDWPVDRTIENLGSIENLQYCADWLAL